MDKNSSIPLYQQMAEDIKYKILTGKLGPNDKLQTEFELSQAYDVSRITVRKAVEILSEEGLVVKRQGIGTFVNAGIKSKITNSVAGFSEVIRLEGMRPSSEVIVMERTRASFGIASHLKLNEGDKVIHIKRVRKIDDRPVSVEEVYFSETFDFLMQENLSKSIYGILKDRGIVPAHSQKKVEICYAGSSESELLGVEIDKALVLVKELVTDAEEKILHYSRIMINPDRYKLLIVN